MSNLSRDLAAALDEVTYEPGTTRIRKGNVPWVKLNSGKWEKSAVVSKEPARDVPKTTTPALRARAEAEMETKKLRDTMNALGKAIKKGFVKTRDSDGNVELVRLDPKKTLDDHARIAEGFLAKHNDTFEEFVADARRLVPGAKVEARVKSLESSLGKILRKPKSYPDASRLQDGSGAQVIVGSLDDVEQAVEKIRKKWKVLSEDDYISKPAGNYRSHHFIAEINGLPKEIQVRTKRQHEYAKWEHDVYKPLNRRQKFLVNKYKGKIHAYGKAMADHLNDLDTGKESPHSRPDCPPEARVSVGCIDKP